MDGLLEVDRNGAFCTAPRQRHPVGLDACGETVHVGSERLDASGGTRGEEHFHCGPHHAVRAVQVACRGEDQRESREGPSSVLPCGANRNVSVEPLDVTTALAGPEKKAPHQLTTPSKSLISRTCRSSGPAGGPGAGPGI